MKKLLATAALALPLFASGYAAAGDVAPLTDSQMDGVTAGASALANAAATAVGNLVVTSAATVTQVAVVATYPSEATTISLMSSLASSSAEALAQ
jgi:hypothetical protein